eukprot:PhF_6_TR40900/c0_g1_i1/m.61867
MVFIISWNVAGWGTTVLSIKSHYNSINNFFQKHHGDIFCLQEVKITHAKLKGCVPGEFGENDDEWESYWSICADASKKGYSGCTTFARKNTVHRACANVFEKKEFDDEGRCIVTHHGSFALFNVYVPNAGNDGSRADFKLRFLEALRGAIQRIRKSWGVPVILVGDLNLCSRPADLHWTYRTFPVQELPGLGSGGRFSDVFLNYLAKSVGESGGSEVDLEIAAKQAARNGIDLQLLKKFSDEFGCLPQCKKSAAAWFQQLCVEDGMVDTFALTHPAAQDRFTCWDQYRNKRYENTGTRIDFILVDSSLATSVVLGDDSATSGDEGIHALAAATSNGQWKPAPMDGSGLMDSSMAVYDTQFSVPHTGMVYTPPKYSDHIGVCVVLDVEVTPVPSGWKMDRTTSACHGQKLQSAGQPSIMNFFQKKTSSSAAAAEKRVREEDNIVIE